MTAIMFLIFGHYLADFPLQGDFLANMKGKNNYLLLSHVIIYSLTISTILHFLGLFAIWKLVLLLVSHVVIDYWKCHYANKETALTTSLYIDQGLHILILIVLL